MKYYIMTAHTTSMVCDCYVLGYLIVHVVVSYDVASIIVSYVTYVNVLIANIIVVINH